MASTDARPLPLKNTAFRVTLPILDADGDLVTGATGLDSEVSIDGGAFADCTNEATEIATNSGMYFLDLTAAEMNGDTISIIVKTSSSGAKTTPIVLYPADDTDMRVNVVDWGGSAAPALVGGRVDVSVGAMAANVLTATAINADAFTAAKFAADVTTELQAGLATAAALATAQTAITAIQGFVDTEVASILAAVDTEVATLVTGVADIQGRLPTALSSGRIIARTEVIATDAVDAAALKADAVTEIQTGLATAAALVTAQTDLTTLVGRLTAIRAGLLDNLASLDATVSSRASAASLATVAAFVDTEVASILAAVDTEVGSILTAATDIQARLPAALVSGRIDASVGAMAADVITSSALSAGAVDEILDDTIGDGTITVRQALRVLIAGMAGKLSGAATTTVTIRNLADSANVVVATVDSDGNRSAVTVTP